MDKFNKDALILDIDNLFQDPPSDDILSSLSKGLAAKQDNSNEIAICLKRLKTILNQMNSLDHSQFEYLFNAIKLLDELYDYYVNLKSELSAETNELKFVENLLIQRLNSLNGKFNLTDCNILFRNPRMEAICQNESLIRILNDYEYNETLVSNQSTCHAKLRIRSIFLEDNLCEDQNISVDQLYLTKSSEYLCTVFQFENNEFLIAEQAKNQLHRMAVVNSSRTHQRQPRSKSHSKPATLMSKRSSSADINTLKHRRSKLDISGKLDEISADDLANQDTQSLLYNTTRLSEKCISINNFKFTHTTNVVAQDLNQIISLKPTCKYVIIMIYKLVQPILDQPDNNFKLPLKYIQLNEHHLKNHSCPLLQNFKLPLSPVIENIIGKPLPQQVLYNESSPSSSMFRRMFKRSKSTNRPRNGPSAGANKEEACLDGAGKPSVRNLIDIDLTFEQNDLISNEFSIEAFANWQTIWKPSLININKHLQHSQRYFQTLTIYLNNLKILNPPETNLTEQSPASLNFYFIEIQITSNGPNKTAFFQSNLFKLNEKINDICQIPFEFDQTASVKFFLYKLAATSAKAYPKLSLLAASNQIETTRIHLGLISDLSLAPGPITSEACSCFYNLKLKCSYQSSYFPTSTRTAVELFNYKLINNLESENDLLELIDDYREKSDHFVEPILIRKFLEFFAILNVALPNDELLSGKKTDRRVIRNLLLTKIYEVFIKVIENCFYSSPTDTSTIGQAVDLTSLLSNFKPQSKQSIHFLLNFLKNQIDTLILCDESHSNLFVTTMKTFDKLVEVIYILSHGNNKSKFEIKYEMNDLIIKLFGTKSQNYSHPRRKSIIISNLNLKFIDTISSLFSGTELATLVFNAFLTGQTNEAILKVLNEEIFRLDVLNSNQLFRDTLMSQLLKTNNLFSEKDILTKDQLDLIMNLLKFRSKLNKQNVEGLVNVTLKLLIHSLINQFKLNQTSEKTSENTILVKNFLCLIETVDIVLMDRVNKSLIENDKVEMSNLFEIIVCYFKCDKFRALTLSERPKLWLKVNLIILSFSKYVQKHLQRYLITCEETSDLNQRSSTASTEATVVSSDGLIRAYIDMTFALIDTPTSSLTLTMRHKHDMLQTLQLFWKCLNINLKRSTSLSEFIVKRLCNSFLVNFYFKLFELDHTKNTILLSPFINRSHLKEQSFIYLFYESLLRFLNDLFVINSTTNFDIFKEFLLINLLNSIIKREKVIRKSKSSLTFKNHSVLIIEKVKQSLNASIFPGDYQRQELFYLLKLCADFNMLKDESLVGNVSIIEKFLVTNELLKKMYQVASTNRLFSNAQYLTDSRRKIKMYLLDDLYALHKVEKNHIFMSFVRKEQADLLEWNYSRKSSNESDLKEILYLKSLKKFALNTMQSDAGTSSPSSSLSSCKASSMSSYMSSQSSISSDSSSTTSPSSSPSSASASPISTPSSLSLSVSLKYEQTSAANTSFISNIQTEICKQLQAYYEKLDDTYPKFTRILNAETKLLQLQASLPIDPATNHPQTPIENSNHHGHLYFRVGIFGHTLKLNSITNRYFLYKHTTYEMLSNIQNLVVSKISNSVNDWHDQTLSLGSEEEPSENHLIHKVSLLHHNQLPDESIKQNCETCYLQICAVNKLESQKLVDLIDEMIETKESLEIRDRLVRQEKSTYLYYFDRPFYKLNRIFENSTKKDLESVENLWIERSLLLIDETAVKFENLTQYEEIKSIFKILLNPVRNAINDINEKTKELKNFIVQFTTDSSQQISQLNVMHRLQPLTMRLLGCLDARVNGGLIKYVKELFTQSLASSKQFKKKSFLMQQLYKSIKDQLNVLESGLSIHNRILKNLQVAESKTDSENENIMENLKHMNQLNDHLIECLKLIERELNERWSKYSVLNR